MDIRRGIILMGIMLIAGQPLAAQAPRDDNYTGLAAALLLMSATPADGVALPWACPDRIG